MVSGVLYVILITLELLLLAGICVYVISLIYSWLKGAPYVPTQSQEVDGILEQAKLTPEMTFVELGSGDGRVVRRAVELYGVKGIGLDVNPELIMRARVIAQTQKLNNIEFEMKDILKADLSRADVLYIFLFPQLIEKMKDKLLNDTKKNVFIISHGFKIPFLSSMLVGERKGKKFTTYYYQKVENLVDKSL